MRIKLIEERVQCSACSKPSARGLSLTCAVPGKQQAQHLES